MCIQNTSLLGQSEEMLKKVKTCKTSGILSPPNHTILYNCTPKSLEHCPRFRSS